VKALKKRGLIDIGAVPAGKGSVDFVSFLSDFLVIVGSRHDML
jgi:hypothetical protein